MIHIFTARRNEVGAELADRIEHHVIIGNRFFGIRGSGLELAAVFEALFLQSSNLFQIHVPEQELNIVIVFIKISHGSNPYLFAHALSFRPPSGVSKASPSGCRIKSGMTVRKFYYYLYLFPDCFDHHRHHLIQIADDLVMGDVEDRGLRVVVDRDDLLAVRHTGLMLNRPADADSDI